MKKCSQAFTLIEMAIVVVIIGFLVSRLLIPLSTQIDQQKIQITEQRLEEIKEALIGYAMINRHLPCPASNLEGKAEQYNLAADDDSRPVICDNGTNDTDAYLPWADLGVNQYDGWNRPFRYRVDGGFSDALQQGIHEFYKNTTLVNTELKLFDPAIQYPPIVEHFLKVQNLAGEPWVTEMGANYQAPNSSASNKFEYYGTYGSEIVAIVFSCGKNGRPDGRINPSNLNKYMIDPNFSPRAFETFNKTEYLANDADGQVNSDAQCSNPYLYADANNKATLDIKTNYIRDAYVEGSFDDILTWLPRNLVINRMLTAGLWSAELKNLPP